MVQKWYNIVPFSKSLKFAILCYFWWRGKDSNLVPSGFEFYVPPVLFATKIIGAIKCENPDQTSVYQMIGDNLDINFLIRTRAG